MTKKSFKNYEEENTTPAIEVVSIGKQAYEKYVKSLGGNLKDYSKGGILIHDDVVYDENNKPQMGVIYNVKVGDSFKGRTGNTNKELSIPVVKITDKRPMGLEYTYSDGGYLIVSDNFLESIGSEGVSRMFIKSNDANKLEEEINNLIKNIDISSLDLNIYNLDEVAKAENSMVLVISIFLYGFITVITLIGITNIFNTLTTTMNLRRKEFAMLKSVGMTTKEFNRMIRLESIFYGLKALVIGLPIGIAVSYLIYKAFINSLEMPYVLPVKSIIIAIVFVFVVIGIIMKFSLSKINKQNIIETIREDNV